MEIDKEFIKALPAALTGAVEGGVKYYVKPYLKENPGVIASGMLAGAIGAYDVLCPEGTTLSETFRRQPLALQLGEIALVGAHLLDLIPKQYDPFSRTLKAVKRLD
jgi:hypothetical protein